VNIHSGIIAAKRALNELHFELGLTGFNQVSILKYSYESVNGRVVKVSSLSSLNYPIDITYVFQI
jgi:hypothetical protein